MVDSDVFKSRALRYTAPRLLDSTVYRLTSGVL